MKKPTTEMVFTVTGYTDKIVITMVDVFTSRSWLTFTRSQLTADVVRNLPWLKNCTEGQSVTLSHIISTGIRLMIQRNQIKKVKSRTTVETEWQLTQGIDNTIYKNITVDSCVAKDTTKIGNRALNIKQMYQINTIL